MLSWELRYTSFSFSRIFESEWAEGSIVIEHRSFFGVVSSRFSILKAIYELFDFLLFNLNNSSSVHQISCSYIVYIHFLVQYELSIHRCHQIMLLPY